MTITELQGSIESHMSRILEKAKKVSEETLKSQVNLNNAVETSQSAESRGRDNFNNVGKGNFKGRGWGNYRGRGRGHFNQGRNNNFGSFGQGRGGDNFGAANRGRGRGNNC